MVRDDLALTIVYNGEVYNYVELRAELERSGYVFSTRTDTEVILCAYDHWGANCVKHFNGMWAFAILDKKHERVFCSRDRFGIKPFYYYDEDDFFAFGSEIRQLLPLLPRVRANRDVVTEFIMNVTPEPYRQTFFDGVFKLPGGHNLTYDLANHVFSVEAYYQLSAKSSKENRSLTENVDAYGTALCDAVKLRLRADVPVGTCLSGGLDSSSVATLASQRYVSATGQRFKAITAVSEQASNDESGFAQVVSDHANLDWITVTPTYDQFVATIGDVVKAQEEPFAGPSICMQFFVMKTAKEHSIPVLLDGQGGDETLLGYERYYAAHFIDLVRRKGLLYGLRSLLTCRRNNANMSVMRMVLFLFYFSFARLRYSNYRRRNRYLKFFPRLPRKIVDSSRAVRDIAALQRREILCDNLPALLRYEDKNSMWHSIETRLPFIDYHAVETALSMPGENKIRNGWTKFALRDFMKEKMPSEIVWRKNKFGFEAPEQIWLTRHIDAMREVVLQSPLIRSLEKSGYLAREFASLDRRTQWRLYSVALWESAFKVEAQ